MSRSAQIEARAGEWLARRDGEAWSASDEADFQAWLAESTEHVVSFVRLEAAWDQAKRLKALGGGVSAGDVPDPERWQMHSTIEPASENVHPHVARSRRWTRFRWAIAAGIFIAIGSGVTAYFWPSGSTFDTPVGGLASVPMSDGSQVTLNTDSRVRLVVSETERRVELERGEAFFDVAKDSQRPFIVAAGDKRVVAVGTQFSVRRDGVEVRVFVTEGTVRIDEATGSAVTAARPDDPSLMLSAGSIARTSEAGVLVEEATVTEVENHLSWRTGQLVFRDIELAEAVAEFNRYNTRKIVIGDPEVAVIRLSGKFRATQFEAFARLMEEGFPIRAQRVGDDIVLSDRRKETERYPVPQP